jgi:hypothetical protein
MVEILIFRVDQFSFWLGFIAGILFAWVFTRAKRAFPSVLRAIGNWIQITRENLTTGTENRIRQDVLNWAQRQHLAAPLFALDEILIQPRLLAPAIYSGLEERFDTLDIASLTVPYMPDWPEMETLYGAPSLTLDEALRGGSDLIIIGQPGSGKTVALATLASQIARRDPGIGEIERLFPLLIPAPALLTKLTHQEPLEAITQTMAACYVSPVVRPRLKGILRFLFQTGRVLLMLDGLDELSQKSSLELKDFVGRTKGLYPQIRVIVTASSDDFAGFNQLGFFPLALAGWNELDKCRFIQQWHEKWTQFIEPDEMSSGNFIDPLLVENWLIPREVNRSPFDITLKTWGAFSGDLLGPGRVNLIEAHFRRMTAEFSNAREILQAIAIEMLNKLSPIILQREAETAANRSGKAVITTPSEPDASPENDGGEFTEQVKTPSRAVSASHLISSQMNNGLLVSFGGSHLAFAHPFFLGFLAGNGITETAEPPDLAKQPDWTGKEVTLGFISACKDVSELVGTLLEKSRQTPIYREVFKIARWMQFAPVTSPWRPAVMRQLFLILQKEFETLSLAGRAVCALALSEDPGVGNLLRSLLKSDHSQIRQMAALGLGFLGEPRFVPDLAALTEDVSPIVGRAACLGLVGIGNKTALDSAITVLLHGSEEMRRAAAEALVNQPQEGVELLKEGLAMEDLLVRRAVIYGMIRSKNPELATLLEKSAIEDAQWVVRNAAAQALEQLQLPNRYIPSPSQPLTQQSWLIKFAEKSGIGVSDEEHGLQLVLQAMEQGDIEERLKALEHLRRFPNLDSVPRLYGVFYTSQEEVKEACFDVIWHTSSTGISLPPPIQFGLG